MMLTIRLLAYNDIILNLELNRSEISLYTLSFACFLEAIHRNYFLLLRKNEYSED